MRVEIAYDFDDLQGHLRLYGASELLEAQVGYSSLPDGSISPEWPEGYLVIASLEGDPFAIETGPDIADSPVHVALHGLGRWDFEPTANSFAAFLLRLGDLLAHPPQSVND